MSDLGQPPAAERARSVLGGILDHARLRHWLIAGMLILAAGGVAGFGFWTLHRGAEETIIRDAERISHAWAEHLSGQLHDIDRILASGQPTDHDREFLKRANTFSDVFRFKLFNGKGELVLTSDRFAEEIHLQALAAHNPKAAAVLATNTPYTEVEDGTQKPDRPDVYAETYLPLKKGDQIAGVIEVYVDQTLAARETRAQFIEFGTAIAAAIALALAIPGGALVWASVSLNRRNRELAAARDAALIAERTKSEFLANMSHEIRTPMNGVLGMVELLMGTSLEKRQRMFASIIQDSANCLLDIINDILDFSKIDAGQLRLEKKTFKLGAIAHEPARLLAPAAGGKGLEILVRMDPGLPGEAVGDFGRIRQVVTNLMTNAVKFTAHGQIEVDISSGPASMGPMAIHVEVRDTGIGIPQGSIGKIFDKFSQVDGSSTRTHEGTGLGLAISKGLVDLMGGEIGVRSNPGQGSTFWFTLPLEPAEAGVVAPMPCAVGIAQKRVLVIDDNETNRFILQEMLSSWRIEPGMAATGREGIQVLANAAANGRPYDLVLLDHQMPVMNGEETLNQLRERTEIAQTPVIFLSSMDEFAPSDGAGGREAQAALTKPVAASQLFDCIATVLSEREAPASAMADCAEAPNAPAPAPPEDGAEDTPHTEIDVLIVEDNPTNQIVASEILKGFKLRFALASDGEEGVQIFTARAPKCVLMDVSMPVLNGYEATARIRELESQSARPPAFVIGLTAHALSGDKERCLEAGMDAFLPKPVSIAALRVLLEENGLLGEGAAPVADLRRA